MGVLEIFWKFYSNDFMFDIQLIANAYIRLPLYEVTWVLFLKREEPFC